MLENSVYLLGVKQRLRLCPSEEIFVDRTAQWYNQVYQQGDVIVFTASYWLSERGTEKDLAHSLRHQQTISRYESVL